MVPFKSWRKGQEDDEQLVDDMIPVVMNASTAAKERVLIRAKPHMPCPDVHPFPLCELKAT